MQKLFLLFFIGVFMSGYSQNEAGIWYFGDHAGLDFSSGNPLPILGGQLSTVEGCSTFSDQNGNLLFYSDGITVYNKNHEVMENGSDLGGNSSSSQSGLIVPSPGNPNLFYLFTVGTNFVGSSGLVENAGFKYYTIDISANGGLGKVNSGFVDLSGSLSDFWSEKVTAVQGSGCDTIWVISFTQDKFYSYLIDNTGVSSTPIISAVSNSTADVRGYLKTSPDATKLVSANMTGGTFLYDFDYDTGMVSNENKLNLNNSFGYGIEFSISSNILYVSTGNNLPNSQEKLYQFNLNLSNFIEINQSRSLIYSYTNTRGALQLASNGKIYWASKDSNKISVINEPEELGVACNYSHRTVDLGGNISMEGLPPFIQSLFLPNVDIVQESNTEIIVEKDLCTGESFLLGPNTSNYPISTTYEWILDGVSLGLPSNTSSLLLDGIIYGSGHYEVFMDYSNGVSCPFYGEATVVFHQKPQLATPITIKQCDDDTDGIAPIDLTFFYPDIFPDYVTENFTFYNNKVDSENGDIVMSILNPENFITGSTGTTPIWVRVENDFCYSIGEVNIVISVANINFSKTIYKCDDYVENVSTDIDGNTQFDLTQIESELLLEFPISQQSSLIFSYFQSLSDAQLQINSIENSTIYRNVNSDTSINPEKIFIRVNNNSNVDCVGLSSNLYIDLVVEELPIANLIDDLKACETFVDSNEAEFNTTVIPNSILQGQTGVSLSYFIIESDASITEISSFDFIQTNYLSTNKEIIVRVTNNTTNDLNGACYDEAIVNLVVNKLPIANPVQIQQLCDDLPDQSDGVSVFDTTNIEQIILGTQSSDNFEIHYYYANGNEISPTLPQFFNTLSQTINVEVLNINNPNCKATTQIQFEVVDDSPNFDISDQLLCDTETINSLEVSIENPDGNYSYYWEDEYGNIVPTLEDNSSVALITKGGNYTVTASSMSQCTTSKEFEVVESSIPTIEKISIYDNLPSNRIFVLVGGIGLYKFSLDNDNFEDSNKPNGHMFYNVSEGTHIIHIKDENGCLPEITSEVIIIRFPRYISPNGDGINDEFFVIGGDGFRTKKLTVFNRFGKIIVVLKNNEKWDGSYNGRVAFESDYWFLAELIDKKGKKYNRKGHFSLKL